MTTIFQIRTPFPGLEARVMLPRVDDNILSLPWLYADAGIVDFHPNLTPETAVELRKLADDIDAAFAVMARRANLSAMEQDLTQFTAIDTEA